MVLISVVWLISPVYELFRPGLEQAVNPVYSPGCIPNVPYLEPKGGVGDLRIRGDRPEVEFHPTSHVVWRFVI